ncbi:hypothetical protein F4810DRAFT_708102 [Camillea tinctor]|nr:hypothetical protein F4810DRAFT_708102 [Camillea tinctor]
MVNFAQDLPPECTGIIWALLEPKELWASVQVCKAWAESATPVLYHDIEIRDREKLHSLIDTTKRRPDLAAFTRCLCMYKDKYQHDYRASARYNPWLILLAQLPNLHTLELQGSWKELEKLLNNGKLKDTHPFNQLRGLTLNYIIEFTGKISPLWEQPMIESLKLPIWVFWDKWKETISSAWPIAQRLEKLDLYTDIDDGAITRILEYSPRLRSLKCWITCNTSDDRYRYQQDFGKMGRGLYHVAETLEDIEFHVTAYAGNNSLPQFSAEDDLVDGHLAPLTGFNRLRSLTIPVAGLLGWTPSQSPELTELLPPSLRHLNLRDDMCRQPRYKWTDKDIAGKLVRFLAAVGRGEYNLQSLEILQNESWTDWEELVKEQLQEMAAKAGVRCIINKPFE